MLQVPKKELGGVQTQAIPNVTQRISTPDSMFGDGGKALMQGADALDKLGARLDKTVLDMQEQKNAARSLELENLARKKVNDAFYNPERGILTRRGGNALGVQNDTAKLFEELRKEYGGMDGENPAVREMLMNKIASLEESYMGMASKHEFNEFQNYKSAQIDASISMAKEDVSFDFTEENFNKKFQDGVKALHAKLNTDGLMGDAKIVASEEKKLYSEMRMAQIEALANQNSPDAIITAKKAYDESLAKNMLQSDEANKIATILDKAYPDALAKKTYRSIGQGFDVTARDDVISTVIDKYEGGAAIVKEPNGGVAKFGINSIANGMTNEQVANLTREQAVEIYRKKYWDVAGMDDVPENMRLLAFEAFINHRAGFREEIVNDIKNGVPMDDVMAKRYQEYDRLRKADPKEYGPHMNGWIARMEKTKKAAKSNPTMDEVQAKAAELDKEYAGAGQALIEVHTRSIDSAKQIKEAAQNEFMDTIIPRLQESNGDVSVLSPTERAKAVELGVWDDVVKYNGVTDPALANEIAGMSDDQFMNFNLNEPKVRARLSQSEYNSLLEKQTNLRDKPAARGEFRTVRGIVSEGWQSMGKETTDPEYYRFQSAAEDAFAYESEMRGGKPLTTDEKRAVVARLTMKSSVGGGYFDGKQKRVYELNPEENYQIDGYSPEEISKASSILVANNIELSQDNAIGVLKNPSKFIKVDGANEEQINRVVNLLVARGKSVTPTTVKRFIELEKGNKNG